MIDGINTSSPSLSGTSEVREAVSKTTVSLGNEQKIETAKQTGQVKDSDTSNVSSAVSKSADKRFSALSSGSAQDFIRAAEKLIEASLPSKPPGTKLRIDVDDGSGRFVYKGIDIKTGDVVVQFPSEEILKLIAFNRERDGVEGIVVDEEA